MPLDERVLVIPEAHFRAIGDFEGFRAADDDYASRLLDASHFSFRARSEVETDPSFKQLIPYVILACADSLFHYRRGAKGTETRLQSLRSIGIGGHISEADSAGQGDPYATGLQRELDEEVAMGAVIRRELLGFIFDPRTPVGRVHLGIVHRLELHQPDAVARDPALAESGFAPLAELRQARGEFESWSQFALDYLATIS